MKDQSFLLRQIRLALQTQNYNAAIEGLQRAALESRQDGDIAAEGRHLGNMALVYYRLNRPEQALHYFGQALASARAGGDRLTENGLLGNMGNILREVGAYQEAVTYLNEALLISQEIGDIRGRGIWLFNLALVCDDLQEPRRAAELHAQSVEVARHLNDRRGLAARLHKLGSSYIAYGDYRSALGPTVEAASLYSAFGDRSLLAQTLSTIAKLYDALAREALSQEDARAYLAHAIDYYRQTFSLLDEIQDQQSASELMPIYEDAAQLFQTINR
jgi:tetratricopeptide (TPR) repeat protein